MDRGSGSANNSHFISESNAAAAAPRKLPVEQKKEDRWYFATDQLRKTPASSGDPPEVNKDVWNRYQCAELVQSIGQRMKLPQFAINTAILYMHRFYQFHSMTRFHRHTMAPVFVFLAAKVDETPRRLDMVVRETHRILYPNEAALEPTSEKYLEELQNMVTHENVLLQTLAFDLVVQHPHSHVIRCCQLIRCDKQLSHAAYDLASCALHFTSLCIQYSPVLVASMCVYVAAKWSNIKIPLSEPDKKAWFYFMDPSLTETQIQKVAEDFLTAVEGYPARVRTKIWNQVLGQGKTPAGYNGPGQPAAKPAAGLATHIKPESASSAVTSGPALLHHTVVKTDQSSSSHSKFPSQVPASGNPQHQLPLPSPQGLSRPPAPKPPGPPVGHRPQAPPPPTEFRSAQPPVKVDKNRDYAELSSQEDARRLQNGQKDDVKAYREHRTSFPVARHGLGSSSLSNGGSLSGPGLVEKRPAYVDSNGHGSPSPKRRRTDADIPVISPENVMRI